MTSLKEGLHYYLENGKMVFTGYYLHERGYCCGSGCRHCPYPKEKDEIVESPDTGLRPLEGQDN